MKLLIGMITGMMIGALISMAGYDFHMWQFWLYIILANALLQPLIALF